VRNALNDETFQRINPGMTRDQVLRLIGPPRDSTRFQRLDQDSWEYYFQDAWGYRALFFVNFDSGGVVVSKFTRRLDYDRDRR
jgi:outer membrane protein assembly factor BamE (lipoprotein component of BamABCDE complex)